jgi:hypothetical protein
MLSDYKIKRRLDELELEAMHMTGMSAKSLHGSFKTSLKMRGITTNVPAERRRLKYIWLCELVTNAQTLNAKRRPAAAPGG